MKKKTKSRLASFFVVSLCLLVFVLSIFFFWKNLNRVTVRSDIQEIGTIQFKYKIAQRKFIDRVAWERLQQNSVLYNGDTIRTADGAMAKLYIDKTTIEVYESTMIQIFYSSDTGVNLSVNSGDISIDTTSADRSINVNFSNGQAFVLEAGSKVSVQSGDLNNLSVLSGIALFTDDKGLVSEISEGETVRVNEEGNIQKVPLSITSVTDNVRLLTLDNSPKKVLLQWRLNDSSYSPVVVETYADKEFTTLENVFIVDDSNSINIDAPVGRLYWKAYLENNKNDFVSGKISVENADAVELVSPAPEQIFTTSALESSVYFSWKGNNFADYYLFELSETPDYSNPIVSQKVYSDSYNCSKIQKGNYYWRVTPFYSTNDIGLGKSTDSNSFKINLMEYPKSPVLVVPAENSTVTLSDDKSNLSFMWKSFGESSDYKLIVASDRNFSRIILEEESSSNRFEKPFNISALSEGDYYWKVVSTNEKGEDGKNLESGIRKFSVVKFIPGENKLIYPQDNFAVEGKNLRNIDFNWKIAEENKLNLDYLYLQISDNSGFRNPVINQKTNENHLTNLKLNSGKYWWRIAVKNSDSDELVYSKANVIHILEDLVSPVITAPEDSFVINKENTIQIKWNKVSGADYYKIKVFDDTKVYYDQKITDLQTSVSLPSSIFTAGNSVNLKCSVQAFASETEFSQLRFTDESVKSFTVNLPSKIVLKTPVNGSTVSGLTALRNSVKFEWSGSENAKEIHFILKRMQPSGTMQTVKTVDNPGNSVSISELRAGNYEWTVKGLSNGNINIDSDQTFAFTITPVPELAGARLVSPAPEQIIDGNYLIENQSVSFKWKTVSNATDYTFVLYQKNEDGRLRKIVSTNTRKTEYKITDLTVLDVGDFEWHVTAYVHNSSGEQQQKSRDAIGRFKIQFDMPDSVNTKDPGALYGE